MTQQTNTWSYPSPVYNSATGEYESGGMVWMGLNPVTDEQMEEFRTVYGDDAVADPLSLCGRWHPDWDTHAGGGGQTGGLGSFCYETQKVGEGVKFAKDTIPYYDSEGNYHKGVPPNCGAYHERLDMSTYVTTYHEGPQPGSEAEALLDDDFYKFNHNKGYYVIRDE